MTLPSSCSIGATLSSEDFFKNIQVLPYNLLKRTMGINISSFLEVFISIQIVQIIDVKPEHIISPIEELLMLAK